MVAMRVALRDSASEDYPISTPLNDNSDRDGGDDDDYDNENDSSTLGTELSRL